VILVILAIALVAVVIVLLHGVSLFLTFALLPILVPVSVFVVMVLFLSSALHAGHLAAPYVLVCANHMIVSHAVQLRSVVSAL
jgi:hypothetical protein